MINKFKHKDFWIIFFADIVIFTFVFIIANLIRFEFTLPIPLDNLKASQYIFPYLLLIKLLSFFVFGIYSSMLRFYSIRELLNIIKASFLSFSIVSILFFIIDRVDGLSKGIVFIDFLLTIILIGGFRLFIRFYFEYFHKNGNFSHNNVTKKRTLIIGAGEAGDKLYREIQKNSNLHYTVVGFIDDDKSKIGHRIHNIPVLSSISKLDKALEKTGAEAVIIAIPSVQDSNKIKKIVEICKLNKIKFKILPPTIDILNDDLNINLLRKVSYNDLLGRKEIKLDNDQIKQNFNDKNILITGAGGSIGSELCKQLCKFNPHSILLFDIAETPLYHIDNFLKKNFPHIKVIPIVGDIKDKEHITEIIKKFKAHIIFHAAAYKHVPMMEWQPWKAVENNVLGTKILLDVSAELEIENFILVSTDKAVNPTSVMGATKRIAEMMLQNKNSESQKTKFMAVRFGNVLGSAGSVIPLFEKQIQEGGPVTVTHPDIERYFMTIPEACLLILQTSSMDLRGGVFILDMGKPIKIMDVAKEMIKFYFSPYKEEIKIKIVGLREGEKLYEELYINEENIEKTPHDKIMVEKPETFRDLETKVYDLIESSKVKDGLVIREKIKQIVSNFQYNSF